MASLVSRARTAPRIGSLPQGAVVPAVVLLGLLALSLFLRTRALGESLWMDEGLSIGIASQPLFDIPGVLRLDGSPPLYYMLLSVWMSAFGDGPADTQALSVAIALLAVPVGLWAGWSLFDRRAGLICAALCAVNPVLTAYAQETRMYSLMLVLSLAMTAAFLHAFAFGRRRYLPLFAVLLALMLYTHNWGLFVTAGALVALVPCLLMSDDRRGFLRDAALGFGGAGLLYLPWLPTLLHQVQHTGAPWLNRPRFGAPLQISKSLLGGGTPTVALLLAGGSGLAAVLQGRVDDRERTAIVAGAALAVGTLAIAWLFSQVSPAWTTRYLGVVLGPILLVGALGLSRAGKLGLVALFIILAVWSSPKTFGLTHKSNAADLRRAAVPELRQGDLVVSMQPEQMPLIHYHLENLGKAPTLSYATPLGGERNPQVMDWTDAQERLENATPAKNLAPLLASLPASGRVLLVHPVTTAVNDWDAPWTELVRRRSAQWGNALATDGRFKRIAAVPPFYRRATRIGVRGVLYEKTG
ncbi:MAG TPA: glycosyltransferase family 39 protein [Thermoleophilaceae bacterium]|nr:glycosyltransferase family 39 protein [Thermoleophilaceae bacterium]